MITHNFLKTPITKEQLKNVIEFEILNQWYSGWRKPNNKKRWLVEDDFVTGGNTGKYHYDFDSDEGVAHFINEKCSEKLNPRGILYVTYADDNKLHSHSHKAPTKKCKFVCPEKMF